MLFRDDTPDALYFMRGIEPRPSSIHGLGIYATEDMPIHYCFEICPVFLFNRDILQQHFDLHESPHILHDYIFGFGGGMVVIAFGYGSMYNHFHDPNALWRLRKEEKWPALEFFTKKEIKAGEEITTRYRPNSAELPFVDEKEAARTRIMLE